MTSGNIRDIRTGRSIGKTQSMETVFVDQLINLRKAGIEHYVVAGPCRMHETRIMIDMLREHGIKVVCDMRIVHDTLYIFQGKPEELGFKVA